jgi:hypothetical protein
MDFAKNATNNTVAGAIAVAVAIPESPDKVMSNQHPIALIDQRFVTASASTLKFKMAKFTPFGR